MAKIAVLGGILTLVYVIKISVNLLIDYANEEKETIKTMFATSPRTGEIANQKQASR